MKLHLFSLNYHPKDRTNWPRKIWKQFSPWLCLISLLTVVLIHSVPSVTAQMPREEIRGVWVTSNDLNVFKDRAQVKDAVTKLRRLNFNTIYPVVWNSGYVMYPSNVAKSLDIQPFVFRGSDGHDILADIINQAHSQNLLAIPWFEFGFMTPNTGELALNKPEWLTKMRDGSTVSISAAGEVSWLNPFHPQVQKFIIDLLVELTNNYDIDGIQFDDHTSLPHQFGYDDYTVNLYKQETGKNPPANSQDSEWVAWRANKITEFMVRLNHTIKQIKPKVIFSVSPNYYDHAYKFQLQDWLNWVRLNIVDELVMQVYRDDLESFTSKIARNEIQEVRKIIPTGIGIMAGLRTSPVPMQQITKQVRTVQREELGIVFFYYETMWNRSPETLEQRIQGFKNFFPYPAVRVAAE
ncbi:MAG: glycoside hydrolase family 10 protein [Cylindrospermopsis raciborskii KL1]|uniref:glycoside hydrolase family 10 protein n=1 Tax=Cylindrospermopsis raciborskii TaxID=77022 RepID=UPI001A352143|nr:glycoside hydrolase family 10 protein [Cylindrospermopsis raciborskii]MBG0742292.1 glycoside hydrolase family 10 protein [Cylindrospermopsis raciborskii KL1]